CREGRRSRGLAARRLEELPCGGIVGLAVERELQVACEVLVTGKDSRLIRQARELGHEGLIELARVTAIVTVARARVEQGIAAEERGWVGPGEQTDVRHRVARRVETLQLESPHAYDVASGESAVDAANTACGPLVRQNLGARRPDETRIAARVIPMLVGVQDLGDLPAFLSRRLQAEPPLQRIDRQRLTGLRAGNEVVEIAVGIGRPDTLDEHPESIPEA